MPRSTLRDDEHEASRTLFSVLLKGPLKKPMLPYLVGLLLCSI